jgi:phage terminase small subunit
MSKRSPITSPSEAVRIVQAAGLPILPPGHIILDECDWPFWRNVVAEFAKAEWTDHQLELAAMLARTMADLAREQVSLRGEGFISVRENGTSVENPRARAVKSLTGDILSLRRSLALHARARSGNSETDAKRREMGKEIERDLGEDELLARPTAH